MSDTQASAAESRLVVDATEATFERDVIERSDEATVIVDFWAPWCAPCRALAPLLDQLIHEAAGELLLVKVDTDKNQNLAMAFGVEGLPTVVAFRGKREINRFVGLLGLEGLKSWLESLKPSGAERRMAEARRLETSDPDAAERLYREAMAENPRDSTAALRLLELLLSLERDADARLVLDGLSVRGYLEPEAETLSARLELRERSRDLPALDVCRGEAAARPDEPAAQLRLAWALAGGGEFEPALEQALSVVRRWPREPRDEAKQLMVTLFRVLGADAELASEYRRKLSQALY